jgi:hypothetical protein
MYGCRRLWVSEFLEDKAYYFSHLCIEKECTKFSFNSQCCNQFENGAGDIDCAIDNDWFGVSWNTTKEEISSCTTSCLRGTEIGGIRVYIEDHVGSSVSDFCIGVRPHVAMNLLTRASASSLGALCCSAIADNAMRMVGSTARA